MDLPVDSVLGDGGRGRKNVLVGFLRFVRPEGHDLGAPRLVRRRRLGRLREIGANQLVVERPLRDERTSSF